MGFALISVALISGALISVALILVALILVALISGALISGAQINEPWATDGKASADKIEILQVFDVKTGEDVTKKYKGKGRLDREREIA